MSTPSTPIASNSYSVYSPRNLTGSARKIEDNKTKIIKELEKWNGCKNEGSQIINEINENLPKKNEMSLKEKVMMTESATQLHGILKSMESVVQKINDISTLMNNSLKLNSMAVESEKIRMKRICEKYEKLANSLRKELEVKRSVYGSFCSFPEYSKLRVLYSLWMRDSFMNYGLMEEFYKVYL